MKFISTMLLAIMLTGCAPYARVSRSIGEPQIASMGNSIVMWENGTRALGYKEEGIQRELLYSGIDGDTISITYRELSKLEGTRYRSAGLYARPAFTQELKYDLGKSRTVTFRDVVLEIQAADNNQIAYLIRKMPFAQTE